MLIFVIWFLWWCLIVILIVCYDMVFLVDGYGRMKMFCVYVVVVKCYNYVLWVMCVIM